MEHLVPEWMRLVAMRARIKDAVPGLSHDAAHSLAEELLVIAHARMETDQCQ